MQTISSVIVDDEILSIEMLKEIIQSVEGIDVKGAFTDPIDAIEFLTEHPETDLIFLDIRMPRMNGFDVVKELHKYGLTPSIVFVTGYDEYAIEAIRAAAFDFLMKPVVKDELIQCIERYFVCKCREKIKEKYQLLLQNADSSHKIIFSHHRGFLAYHPDEIYYVSSDGNYSFLNLTSGKRQIVTMQIGKIEEVLAKWQFFRINRSSLINTKYLTHADQKERRVYLENSEQRIEFETTLKKIKELLDLLSGTNQ